MPLYKIADLNILINPEYSSTAKRLLPYITVAEAPDFDATATADEVLEYLQSTPSCPPDEAESVVILRKICTTILNKYNGFFFHSSSVMVDGKAYVFSAVSGTGKSTHTSLWCRHFGDKAVMINDDKPIIRKTNGNFYIYGTPWMGKSNIGNNVKSPIKAVYILQRGTQNSARRVSTGDVFKQIFEATVVPRERSQMNTLLSLLDEFFSSVPLFLLTCNISENAVTTAYNAANNINAKDNAQ